MLDDADRQIISLLEKNPAITQSEMAKIVGISQSSIAVRLARLRKSGLLRIMAGVDIKRAGLTLGRVDISTKDPAGVISFAKKCPLFVNALVSVGQKNVTLFFVAEGMETFQSLVNDHLGRLESINDIDFNLVFPYMGEATLPVETNPLTGPTSPCGLPFCPGCPADPDYKGKFWRSHEG
jgi:Lrp/AsnC family leucine-responsive transcriptional regulator